MQVREFGVEGEIRMNKLTSKSDFAAFLLYSILLTSFPFQNKVPSPCDTKIIQRELEDDYGFFPSIISHHFSLLTLSSSSSKEIPHSVWPRDLCLLFPVFKVAYSVFFNWITSPHLSRLRWNAPFSKEDLFNTPYSLFSRVPPSVLPEKTEVMHQLLTAVTPEYYTRLFIPASLAYLEKRSVLFGTWYLMLIAWGVNQWVS